MTPCEASDDLREPTILHVVEAFGGGVADAVREYARNTPDCEHHLLCHLRPEASILEQGWQEEFSSVDYLPTGHLANLRKTRNAIRRIKPDIVHSHSSYGGVYARLGAPRSSSIKQIYTPHSWSFDRQDRNCAIRLAFWLLEGVLATRTDLIAGCSPAEIESARWGPVHPPTLYLPNITSNTKSAFDARPRAKKLLVVGAGRLSPQKDPGFFLDCMHALWGEGIEVQALWIGGGNDTIKRQLESEGVEVTGWIDHADALIHLGRADIYLHTARWEGFPIMVLEAAATGLPVVVRRIRAFQHSGLPAIIDGPESFVRLWPVLENASMRTRLAALTRAVLWENCNEVQQRRLQEAYELHSTNLTVTNVQTHLRGRNQKQRNINPTYATSAPTTL